MNPSDSNTNNNTSRTTFPLRNPHGFFPLLPQVNPLPPIIHYPNSNLPNQGEIINLQSRSLTSRDNNNDSENMVENESNSEGNSQYYDDLDQNSENESLISIYFPQPDNRNRTPSDDTERPSPRQNEDNDIKWNMKKLNFTPYSQLYRSQNRVSTAPILPLNEFEEFKRSKEFYLLEKLAILTNQLIQKSDNKFDLDSREGRKSCKSYLKSI